MSYKYDVKIGDVVLYKNKKYVVIGDDFYLGGHIRIIQIVKINRPFGICLVKSLEEEEINKCSKIN